MGKRVFYFLIIAFLFIFACKPHDETPEDTTPDYVGTWFGYDVYEPLTDDFYNITLILTETTYEIDIYDDADDDRTTLLANSVKGTHGELTQNTVETFNQTQGYDGAAWQLAVETRYVQYSISGITMHASYDYDDPHDAWDVEGDYIKQ